MIQDEEKRKAQVQRADDFIRAYGWDLRKAEYLGLVDALVRPGKLGAKS
jgi:hypothetical protein